MKSFSGKQETYFIIEVSPEALRKEKDQARAMRKTQWWQRQIGKGRCAYCGKSVAPKELTMDHVVPMIRGGKSTRGNLTPSCKACNSQKKYLLPIEWDEYLQTVRTGASADDAVRAYPVEE